MTYNIIGDIHGRTEWEQVVQEDAINIFVGDYFDPYDEIPFADMMVNFLTILAYKQSHPQTVLLYGNHDLHYISSYDRSSRYDAQHAVLIMQAFEGHRSLFDGVAYPIDNRILVTHAGVTKEWYEKEFGPYEAYSVNEVAENINDLWLHNKVEFAFETNVGSFMDFAGTSPTHSPLWIRPNILADHNLFAGTEYKQVFGHTQMENIIVIDECLICVDCLGSIARSYTLEVQ